MRSQIYDQIGRTYTSTRCADPRIAAAILNALGDAETVVNVGAGAGAYEPADRAVVAVEPSWRMIQQRASGPSGVVQAVAESLPFQDRTFDAALAVLTLHHWRDWRRGLDEVKRVAHRLVMFAFDPGQTGSFWLVRDYFPEIVDLDRRAPSIAELTHHLGNCRVDRVTIPHDCADGFLAAFWRRPEAYLDPHVRAGISSFATLDEEVVTRGVEQLRRDLASGVWDQRFGHLRSLEALDSNYRLFVTD